MDPFEQLGTNTHPQAPMEPPMHARPAEVPTETGQCFLCELAGGKLDKIPHGPLKLIIDFIKKNMSRLKSEIFYERLDVLYREEFQRVALEKYRTRCPNWPRSLIKAHFTEHVKYPTMIYLGMLERYGYLQEKLWDKAYDANLEEIDSAALNNSLRVSELILKVLEKSPAESFLYDSIFEGSGTINE